MNPEIDSQTLVAACGIVRKQSDKLARHLQQLDQPDDIEQVHQARVACRRMRQAFAFFDDCFDAEQMTEWKTATKKLLRRLSLARDIDVHAVFLRTFIDAIDMDNKKTRPGLERLLLRLQQRRCQAQDEVLNAVAKFQKQKILINIHLQTEKILFLLRLVQPPTQDALRQRIQKRLESAFEQVEEKETALKDAEDFAGHHALRIAIKRFRYRLEIVDSLTGGALNSFVNTAKTLQTLLGGLHDCVVWQETLDAFIEDEKKQMKEFCGHTRSFGRMIPGIKYLSRDRKNAAKDLYRQTCEYVDQIHNDNPWQQVFDVISQQPLGEVNEQTD
jgi:CHAD domain-containing protein